MIAILIVREEIQRVGKQLSMPIEARRRLVKLAKRANRQGTNARAIVSRAIIGMKGECDAVRVD